MIRNAQIGLLAAGALSASLLAVAPATAGASAQASSPSATSIAATEVNTKPAVVPALQEWEGGQGSFLLRPGAKIVIPSADADQLAEVGKQLASDIAEYAGVRIRVAAGKTVRAGDIVLDIDEEQTVGPDTDLTRAEGYTVDVSDTANISARTEQGVFWGTRTLLQSLDRQSKNKSVLPRGVATDWPNYAVRGFMLDVGRRWFEPSFVRDYIRYMSWFKLNTFQIHLNDNEIFPADDDWSQAYSAFRLASDNPRFAGLAATDGAYTRADWDRMEEVAADHFVDIVPEIDAPAHSRAFIEFNPELGLNNGNSDHLDLTKPATTEFMKDVFSEFTPWFRGEKVHFGADEYPREYSEEYREYFNAMAEHVRSLGKEPMAWGSFSVMSGSSDGYDKDVLINSWNNGWYGPKSAVADGYPVVNTNDGLLYLVPFAPYYHGNGLDGRYLYENWEPNIFGGGQDLEPGEPLLQGSISAVWNDLVHADYDGPDVHGLVEPTFGILGHKMWHGAEADLSYEQFMTTVSELGVGPGMEDLTSSLLNPGDPGLEIAVTSPDSLLAGSSGTATASVTNNGDTPLHRATAVLTFSDATVTAAIEESGPKVLEPGETGVWRWTVTANDDAGWRTHDGVLALSGTLNGVPELAQRAVQLHTEQPPPAGTVELAGDAVATASSVEADLDRLAAANVNDGDSTTRWASDYHDDEWVQLELAEPAAVQQIQLEWEPACALEYQIQVSADGTNWTTAATVDESTCLVDVVDVEVADPVSFVRMQGVTRASGYGYSIFEFRVYGDPAA